MNDFPNQNTGVLIDQRPSDYIAGTLPYKEITNGDWRPYLPIGESQFNKNFDFMDCVTESAENSLEIQQIQQIGKEINLSGRFTAKMSGTTHQGNYQYKVADSIRIDGVVLESDYSPSPNDTWDTFYKEIPSDVKAKVLKVDMSYEWIGTDLVSLKYHLKHAPIQITIPLVHPDHAVCLVYIDDKNILYYFDTYSNSGSYIKTMSSLPASAMKIVLNKPIGEGMTNSLIVQNGAEFGIYDPATSEDGLITLMRNRGIPVFLTADGKLDWSKINITKQLTNK